MPIEAEFHTHSGLLDPSVNGSDLITLDIVAGETYFVQGEILWGWPAGRPKFNIVLHVKRRVSRVFVAAATEHPNSIVGYYTLSPLSIELCQLPEALARKLPRHPVSAALLGRLAVNQRAQGHGVGGMLLVDAIKRTLAISDEIAIYAMVVNVIYERAQRF